MILTVAQTYPSEKNLYNNGFVHSRVKQYINDGIPSQVYVLNSKIKDYEIEGVSVKCGNAKGLAQFVNDSNDIDCICFHFLNTSMLKAIEKFNNKKNIVIFVHGNEALWWYERIFPDRFSGIVRTLKFVKYVGINTYSILSIKRKINRLRHNIHIVCVSEWMKNVAVKNWMLDTKKVQTHIIPNIINENVFVYNQKCPEDRYKILFIRQFTSGKYALDIAMDTISKLQTYPEAKDIQITIIGDGWLFDKYTSRVSNYENVRIERRFLSHSEIAEMHRKNGIFLCPTRQDAQGVSMCEAMSSGLVPISSLNTAIPEFLPSSYGLCLTNAEDSAEKIIELIRHPEMFCDLSRKVSTFINEKCCVEETTAKEIALMKSMGNRK